MVCIKTQIIWHTLLRISIPFAAAVCLLPLPDRVSGGQHPALSVRTNRTRRRIRHYQVWDNMVKQRLAYLVESR